MRRAAAVLSAILLAAGPLFPGTPVAQAGGARVLSLDDAIGIAYERNRDIAKAVEFRRQVEGRYVAERAAALPQVAISVSGARSWDESEALFGTPPGMNSWKAEAGLSQALYTWGQIGAAIRAARIGFESADDQLRIFRQAAARDVSASFYDVLLARELKAIAVQNLEQKNRHLDEARRKLSAGTATEYDVLAAEVDVENARPAVLQTENLAKTSLDRLRFLLALETTEIDVQGTLVSPVAPAPSYEEVREEAWRKRPELSEVRHRIGIGEELVTIADAGDKPRLDFKGGYGWRELDAGGVSAEGKAWSAGLFLSWPLFDGLASRGRVAQARSEAVSLRIEEAKLLDSVALEARDAVNAVRESGEIVKALSGTVAQAERLLGMAEKGFEHGVKTRLEVGDAELSLVQARGNLAKARRDHLVANVTLEYVKGSLGTTRDFETEIGKKWRPAATVPGMVEEVLKGKPGLKR